MSTPALDIDALTPAQRWDLIERLWTSLGDAPSELTQDQRDELERRSAALDADLEAGRPLGRPWSEVKGRLFRKPSEE